MKSKEFKMNKCTLIALSLFSSIICFSQNTDNSVKELTKNPVKVGSEEKVKPSLTEEYTGSKPNPIHPDSLQVILYNPSDINTEKKASSTDKNASKPH
ncbi:MAG TPA: hypothetical protein PLC65_05895 [Bacteroidia bacterium]|nr:hypothetical protein [Bacteroidia bacterium]